MSKRLNVLLFTNLFPTPVDPTRGVFIDQLVRRLREHVDLTVMCPLPWFPKWPFLRTLKNWYPFSQIPERYEVDGLPVYSPKYPLIPRVSEAFHASAVFLGAARTVARLHHEKKFDIINGHWLYPDGVVAAWLAALMEAPLVLSGRGCDVNHFLNRWEKRRPILKALERAKKVTVVSEALRARLIHENLPSEKVVAIPNGVDFELFQLSSRPECLAKLDLSITGKNIVFVGQLLDIKGVDNLLHASALLAQHRADFTVYLVGDSSYRKSYEAMAYDLGVATRVQFVGNRPHKEIAAWIGAADVLCLPSLREGWPNVVMEALASGRPVVATRVGGIPEMVNERNGILVEPKQSRQLAEAIGTALEKSWNPSDIRRTVDHLTWEKTAECYARVFEETVKKGNA